MNNFLTKMRTEKMNLKKEYKGKKEIEICKKFVRIKRLCKDKLKLQRKQKNVPRIKKANIDLHYCYVGFKKCTVLRDLVGIHKTS